jgi:hypothetical protein
MNDQFIDVAIQFPQNHPLGLFLSSLSTDQKTLSLVIGLTILNELPTTFGDAHDKQRFKDIYETKVETLK